VGSTAHYASQGAYGFALDIQVYAHLVKGLYEP